MIALGGDHGGFVLKEMLVLYLKSKGYEVKDCGTFECEAVDYPDIAGQVCDAVLSGECGCGILICGTGIGVSIAANKIKGIRAALCSDTYSARMAKQHNNAKVIALGGRVIGEELAYELVNAYLGEQFAGGRHQIRVDKIMELEGIQNER